MTCADAALVECIAKQLGLSEPSERKLLRERLEILPDVVARYGTLRRDSPTVLVGIVITKTGHATEVLVKKSRYWKKIGHPGAVNLCFNAITNRFDAFTKHQGDPLQ